MRSLTSSKGTSAPRLENLWPPGRSAAGSWTPTHGRPPLNLVWCPKAGLQPSTLQQSCLLKHVFLPFPRWPIHSLWATSAQRDVAVPSSNRTLLSTHLRKPTVEPPGSHSVCGQGFWSSADVKGDLTGPTMLEICTVMLSGAKGKSGHRSADLPKANPTTCNAQQGKVILGQQEERKLKENQYQSQVNG